MQILILIVLLTFVPVFSYLRIDNWSQYHKPTPSPTFKPTYIPPTPYPSGPSYSPTPVPTTPTAEPSPIPTAPTFEPTTHAPTVYDFKTMNYPGYIATCVLIPYACIGYTCIITLWMVGTGRCPKWCGSIPDEDLDIEIGT